MNIDDNNYILNPKLTELVNKIINFYHSNNNKNMNYNNPNQINGLLNNLNPNYPGLHQSNEIKDPLPYVRGEKKLIRLINSNYDIINAKIPKDITKFDFYSIVKIYKAFQISNMILIHKANILAHDESSIEEIMEGDTIIIIEDRDYPDDSYFNYIGQKYQSIDKLNIKFESRFPRFNFIFSKDITISEMIKAYNLINGINNRNFYFYNRGNQINPNDQTKIGKIYNDKEKIEVYERLNVIGGIILFGKIIKASTKINGVIIERKIGTLNSTQRLFDNGLFGQYIKNNEKIYINKIIITQEDYISFKNLGIKNDFTFVIK